MSTSRYQTVFSLRFAVRVLERQAVIWSRIDATMRLVAIFSGTAALMALMGGRPWLTTGLGVFFAILQSAQYALDPAARRAEAVQQRKRYAKLFAQKHKYSDEDLETEYQAIVADDEVICTRRVRELAYNDVLEEMGCNPEERYRPSRFWDLLSA